MSEQNVLERAQSSEQNLVAQTARANLLEDFLTPGKAGLLSDGSGLPAHSLTRQVLLQQKMSSSDSTTDPSKDEQSQQEPLLKAGLYDRYGSTFSAATFIGGMHFIAKPAMNATGSFKPLGAVLAGAGTLQGIGDGINLYNAQSASERAKWAVCLGLDAGMIAGGIGFAAQFARASHPWLVPTIGLGSLAARFIIDRAWTPTKR